MSKNKVHLPVIKSQSGWYFFAKKQYQLNFAGDRRLGGYWIEQYARKLGYNNLMKEFLVVLAAIEKDNQIRKEKWLPQIWIFNLYIEDGENKSE